MAGWVPVRGWRHGARRRAWWCALALPLGVACQAQPVPSPAPQGADTLTLAVRADVTGFFPNPPIVSEAFTLQANRSVFESLVRFDDRLRLVPGLAERWENPDDRTTVFELKPGLRFSDGRPLGARDVAASLEAALRRGWITRDYLQAIESVRAIGERRVEVRTRFPFLGLITRLPWGFVLPADEVDKTPVPSLGSGPYRLDGWTPGQGFTLARNPHHAGPAPAFERVRYVVVPEDAARVALVEKGEADAADNVPLADLSRLESLPGVRLFVRSGLRVLFLCLRVDRPPFSDPRVREAVDLALDRRLLVARAVAGRAELATQVVPPSIVGFNTRIDAPRHDPERARALLRQAGFAGGLEIPLDGPFNRYVNDREILREVARQLAQVGIRARVDARDKTEFFRHIESGASRFHLLGFACESGDAGDVLVSLFHSPGPSGLGVFNTLGLADAELDSLIDAADRSRSNEDRQAQLQRAMARLSQLRAALPLLVQAEAVLLSRRIGWKPPINLALEPERMRPLAAAR